MNSLYTAEGVMDKHSLWQRYVPLVRHEALRLQVRLPASVELDDLLQAGGIGLLNAVERYDALQGTAFTTYAVQRIRGAMLDELRSRDWVPRSVRRNAREVAQAIGQLEQELGRNATETEVAERLGIDIADYRQMLLDTNNSQLFSYDEWREEHGDSIELVTDDHQRENPLQQLLDSNLRQRVMEAIETLPEREKLVLTLYYQGRAESQRDWRGAGGRGNRGSVSYTARLLNGYALNWVSYNVSKCRTLTLTTREFLMMVQHLKKTAIKPLS